MRVDGITFSPELVANAAHARSRPAGLKPSAARLTIVCGPAASGKTTYVQQHASEGDIVIDLDHIAHRLCNGAYGRDRPAWLLEAALKERNKMLRSLATTTAKAAWFIVAAPSKDERDWWASQLRPVHIEVILTPLSVCIERIKADRNRRMIEAKSIEWATTWWQTYTATTQAGGRSKV